MMTLQTADPFPVAIRHSIENERRTIGPAGIDQLLEAGRSFSLSSFLQKGGALLFAHTYLSRCGSQVAACVHALLDSGADRALVVGVLHPFAGKLEEARARFLAGADPKGESLRGIQGLNCGPRQEWQEEFSLLNFAFLLEWEAKRRGRVPPQLITRYPYLTGEHPEDLAGIEELQCLAQEMPLLVTGDLFHHGRGYQTPVDDLILPEEGGVERATREIDGALASLAQGDYDTFLTHSYQSRSDFWNVGPVLRHLLGPFTFAIHDLTWADTSEYCDKPPPNWVAAALIAFNPSLSPVVSNLPCGATPPDFSRTSCI